MTRDDSERPKKSWRERDAQRNHSKHTSSGDGRQESPKALQSSASARAALDRAFNDGLIAKLVAQREAAKTSAGEPTPPAELEAAAVGMSAGAVAGSAGSAGGGVARRVAPVSPGDSQRPELMKKIRITEARAEVNALIDELYSISSELPHDWEILTRSLDHDRDEIVRASLVRMETLLVKERPPRRASLVQRLIGLIADTSDDDVRNLAEDVRQKLG